jgi:rod shape determining protein RodA
MNSLRKTFVEMDFVIIVVSLALTILGILSIYSSGLTAEGLHVSNEYLKQIFWAVSGILIAVALALVDYQRIKDYSFFIYLFFVVLVVFVRFFGKVVNGARSWIGLFGDYGIQPSEFLKIATVLYLSQYLSNSEHYKPFRRLIGAFVIIIIPVVAVISQSDLGTALVFFPIFLFAIYAAGLERRYIVFIIAACLSTVVLTILPHWEKNVLQSSTGFLFIFYRSPYNLLLILLSCAVAALSIWGWLSFKKRYYYWIAYVSLIAAGAIGVAFLANKALKEYQIMRLIAFLDPSIDPRASGWNILQSITAIGSGGFLGKGFLQGTQSHYRYLPQQSTDFIFSIIAEEWGFLGGLFVFSLYFILLRRCAMLIKTAKDGYASCIAAGLMGMYFFHFMVNAGMAMGIMPVTGIPLFFLSYGGSCMWTAMAGIGLLLGISARRFRT